MPAIRDILKHVRVEQAGRKRKCRRHQRTHQIRKGDLCLVIQEGQDAPNYCTECADEILVLAQTTLNNLQQALSQTQQHAPLAVELGDVAQAK